MPKAWQALCATSAGSSQGARSTPSAVQLGNIFCQRGPRLSLPVRPLRQTALQLILRRRKGACFCFHCARFAPLRRAEALGFLQAAVKQGRKLLLQPPPHGCVARKLAARTGRRIARPPSLARRTRPCRACAVAGWWRLGRMGRPRILRCPSFAEPVGGCGSRARRGAPWRSPLSGRRRQRKRAEVRAFVAAVECTAGDFKVWTGSEYVCRGIPFLDAGVCPPFAHRDQWEQP